MKFIRQFGIILIISFLGEILKSIIPLQIPASIYGLVLMLIALKTKIIPVEKVKDAGKFMIEIMPVMFIPAAVGLVDSWIVLKPIFIQISIVTIVSTILVMGVSGKVTEFIINRDRRNNHE